MKKPKTKSVLSWFGSDGEIAARLGGKLDHCRHVVIPFCGGLSILPHLRANHIVANDLHEHAIHFYDTLRSNNGTSQQLIERCHDDVFSHPAKLREAKVSLDNDDVVVRAWAFWATCWLGRHGQGGTESTSSSTSVRWSAVGGNNASRLRTVAADLHAWAEQFKRCEFLCRDFREVLSKVKDRPDCGLYIDPPWIDKGDAYKHSFTEQDHRELADLLMRFKETTVLVRYGDVPLIRELYAGDRWQIEIAVSRSQSNGKVDEVWITQRKENGG